MEESKAVYADLLENHKHLLEPHGEAHCKEWEIQHTELLNLEELNERLKLRQRQHKAVIELVTTKVKENYTRFVQGINKIQEVGACSDQTIRICDMGKTRLKMTKDGLIVKALKISHIQRKRVNMTRVRNVLAMVEKISAKHQEVQRLISAGRQPEAALHITEGQKELESTTDDVRNLSCIKEISKAWSELRSTLYHTHIDKCLNECCKRFDIAQFEAGVTAVISLGYEKESSASLVNKWRHVVGLIALASLRPFAIKNKGSDEVSKADVRMLMRMLQPDDLVKALQELTRNLAHSMWTFKAMLNYVSTDPKFHHWHCALTAFKPEFWSTVQGKLTDFLTSCKYHSLSLQSFMSLVTSFKMFAAYGECFHGPISAPLEDLLHTLTKNYLSEVFHKEATEITRMGVKHETCINLTVDEANEKVSEGLVVNVVPLADEVKNLCRLARDFDEAENINANPFVLQENGGEDKGHSGGIACTLVKEPILASGLEVLQRIQRYSELMVVFPKTSSDIHTQLHQLVSFFLYMIFANFCDVRTADTVYHPEKDAHLPLHTVAHLDEMRLNAAKHVPKELNVETGEQKPFEPPTLQSVQVKGKLTSHAELYGYQERYIAMGTVSQVLNKLEELWNGKDKVAAGDTARLISTTEVMVKSMTQRLAVRMCSFDAYPKMISECKWEPRALESDSNIYVHTILRDVRGVADRMGQHCSGTPRLWEAIVNHLWHVVVKGYSMVKKCNTEGRALMSLDLQTLQHSLKSIVQGSIPHPDIVEEYVKAFYLEADDYLSWVRSSHMKYTAKQLLALPNINNRYIDRIRKDNKEFNKKIEEELLALEHTDPSPLDVS